MNQLYYQSHPFTNQVSAGFSFDEETVKTMIRRIYEKKFNPLTEIDEAVFNETWNLFNHATDEGFGIPDYGDPEYDFYQQIRYNNAVFSTFRTHRLQNDVAAQLLDENGNLRDLNSFLTAVEPITDHNVQQWLRTEYDTAILRAHQAADWVQFDRVKDILPNLRWMPTTSITPDLVHKRYWEAELTLPQDHPFWKLHRPGDRWNCKCSLEATDDPENGAYVLDDEEQPKPDPGLDNNPGQDAMLFSFSHPYFAAGYWAYKKLAPMVTKFVEKQLEARKTKVFFSVRKQALASVKYIPQRTDISNLQTGVFYNSTKKVKILLHHCLNINEVEAAMSLPANIKKLEFVRPSPLGEGKDMSNPVDVANVAKKIERGVKQYNIYKYKYRGRVHYIKLEENGCGEESLYSFTKKP